MTFWNWVTNQFISQYVPPDALQTTVFRAIWQMFESSIKHMISGVDILIAGRYSRADELRIK